MPQFKYSADGKTVVVGGKTYSVSAFEKQFNKAEFTGLDVKRKVGGANKNINAPEVKKVNSNPTAGKTQVSSMATKRGPSRLAGGGLGGMFGIKNR